MWQLQNEWKYDVDSDDVALLSLLLWCCLLLGSESYGRIVFHKPTKRSSDTSSAVLSASSMSKKAKTEDESSRSSDSNAEPHTHRTNRTADKVKPNTSLLSFNDDEDDDDD